MERVYSIIKILLQSNKFFSYDVLAEMFDVSTRTIRTDVDKADYLLGKYGISIVKDKKKGISIREKVSDELYSQITRGLKTTDYYNSQERMALILGAFLMEKENLTVSYLIQITKSSRTTVLKDLTFCEEWFKERNIRVLKTPYVGMKLLYEEWNFRNAILDYLALYTQKMDFFFVNQHFQKEAVPGPDFLDEVALYYTQGINQEIIHRFINSYENREKVRFTNEAYFNIVLYVNVLIKRVENSFCIEEDREEDANNVCGDRLIKNITFYQKLLNEELQTIVLSKTEIKYLLVYILAQNKVYCQLDNSFINERELALRYIQAVQIYLGINLMDDTELFDNLLFHIIPTIHRLLYKIKVDNPLKDEVKQQFPEVYRANRRAIKIFEEELKCEVNEDEITLLTLHTAAAVERIKQQTRASNVKKAIVVCLSGIGTSNMLLARLNTEFPSLLVKKVLTLDELVELDIEDYDFIISTVQLSLNSKKKFIQVDPLLKENDIRRIENLIYSITVRNNSPNKENLTEELLNLVAEECGDKEVENLRTKIADFLDERVYGENYKKKGIEKYLNIQSVELRQPAKDRKEAIECAGKLLLRQGLIEEQYIDSMVRMAEISSEYIVIDEGIALAHAKPKDGVIKSGMSFVTFDHEVDFGDSEYKPVKIVIGLAADGSADHIEALNDIAAILHTECAVKRWYEQSTKEEFIQFALNNKVQAGG